MKSKIRSLVFMLLVFLVCSNSLFATVCINQNGVGRGSGCTVVSLELILQNCGLLDSQYQLSGTIESRTPEYRKFDSACSGFYQGDAWLLAQFTTVANKLTNSKWSVGFDTTGSTQGEARKKDYNSVTAVVGLGNKDFRQMTKSEQITAVKALANSGYYMVAGFTSSMGPAANGPSSHRAGHVTMIDSVSSDIMLNDPATGSVISLKERFNKRNYSLVYVVCFKNDKSTPSGTGAGPVDGSEVTSTDATNAESLGVGLDAVKGYYSEEQLSKQLRLTEFNIADMLPDDASVLNQKQTETVSLWNASIIKANESKGLMHFFRVAVVFLGFLCVAYAIILYLVFWVDTVCGFNLNLLKIISLGKLEISGAKETIASDGVHYVNHRAILGICIVLLVFGMLILTGKGFYMINELINLVRSWLNI